MGLDSVEMVIEVEEAFGIKIPDDVAAAVRTVGDLHQLIVESLGDGRKSSGICLSAATFRLIRQAVNTGLSVQTSIRPGDQIDAILPRRHRRQVWSQLTHSLDLRLPSLARSSWVVWSAVVVTLVFAAMATYVAALSLGDVLASTIGVLSFFIVATFMAFVTSPLAIYPRPTFASFGGLTNVVLAQNYSQLSNRFKSGGSADVWNAVRMIVVEQLGVEPGQVTPNARFVEDLGMD
jgi:acyl carrier protein